MAGVHVKPNDVHVALSHQFVQFFGEVDIKLFSWVRVSDASAYQGMDLLIPCGCFLAVCWGFAWSVTGINKEGSGTIEANFLFCPSS